LVLEVWVVDNASSDNSVEVLRSRYPWVHLIANQENRGFARANNQAIRQARGRCILILNPDTVVPEGAVERLYRFLAKHDDAGMVGPRLLDGNGKIWEMGARRLFSLGTAFWVESLSAQRVPWVGPWLFRRFWAPYDFAVTQEVECISGAAMLARREVLEQMQGFGETFRHCGEDLDLCFRLRAAGWKVYYDADTTIVHLVGRSADQAGLRCNVDVVLSNEEYFIRCYGRLYGRSYRLINRCVCLPKVVITAVGKYMAGALSRAAVRERMKFARFLLTWKEPE
jgi:GT2 family glycosyltransferase